jgi:hypothetical protein
MGDEDASTMMEMLAPVGWGDIATKQDLEALRVATKQDIEILRNDLGKDIDILRNDLGKDIDVLRAVTRQDIAELRAHMDETLRKQFNTIMTFTVGLVSGGSALIALGAAVF